MACNSAGDCKKIEQEWFVVVAESIDLCYPLYKVLFVMLSSFYLFGLEMSLFVPLYYKSFALFPICCLQEINCRAFIS